MVDSSLKTRQLVLSTRSRAGTDVSDVPPSEGVDAIRGSTQEVVGVQAVGEGGCSPGRLARREAAGSERALWQTALVPGLPFVSWEMQLGQERDFLK